MSKERDNFSKDVKLTLAQQVCNHCSYCKNPTAAAHSDEVRAINVGVAAHINSAGRKGGPRHNSNMTQEERSSIENGIWLCQTCGKLVDSDIEQFPVSKLKAIKKNAIKEWRDRMMNSKGKQILSSIDDIRHYRYSGHTQYGNLIRQDKVGEFRFYFTIRLRNDSPSEQILKNPIIQIRKNESVLYAQDYESYKELRLESGKWVDKKDMSIFLPQPQCNFLDEGDSVFMTFTVLGEETLFSVKLLEITEEVRAKTANYSEPQHALPITIPYGDLLTQDRPWLRNW